MDQVVPFGCCGFEHGEPHWEDLDRVVCIGGNLWTFLVLCRGAGEVTWSQGGMEAQWKEKGVGRALGADTRGDERGVRLAGEGLLSWSEGRAWGASFF